MITLSLWLPYWGSQGRLIDENTYCRIVCCAVVLLPYWGLIGKTER